MFGLVLGLACGLLEFWLLRLVVNAITGGNVTKVAYLAPIKLILMLGVLLVVAFYKPSQLYLSGIGIAAPIILGSLCCFVINSIKRKGDGNDDA